MSQPPPSQKGISLRNSVRAITAANSFGVKPASGPLRPTIPPPISSRGHAPPSTRGQIVHVEVLCRNYSCTME